MCRAWFKSLGAQDSVHMHIIFLKSTKVKVDYNTKTMFL